MPERAPDLNPEADRRHPARAFDPALICDWLGGRAIRAVMRFSGGKSNTNYRLELEGGEICVVRLLAQPAAARESRVMRLASRIVPVPEVLAEGSDWLILAHLEGRPMADHAGETRAAAEALARLSALRYPSAGWLQADGGIAPFDFGGGSDDFIGSILSHPEVRRWFAAGLLPELEAILAAQAKRDEARSEGICLCHGDFNPGNLLFHEGRLSAVLDWEFAHAGSPFMDLGNLVRHTPPGLHASIAEGFAAAGRELPADWLARAEFMDLSSHLEFLTSARSDDFKRRCAEWVRAFIARYGRR
jgi:aminoglycoside phosphotransferase (APT) family kinase protein